jgi:hypothetical protein
MSCQPWVVMGWSGWLPCQPHASSCLLVVDSPSCQPRPPAHLPPPGAIARPVAWQVVAALLVAVKQIMPLHELKLAGGKAGRLQVKVRAAVVAWFWSE